MGLMVNIIFITLISLLMTFKASEAKDCMGIAQCEGHEVCFENKCTLCTKTEQCPSSTYFCLDKKCVKCSGYGGPCRKKNHCCNQKYDCVEGQFCLPDKACKTDSDCQIGQQVCELKQGYKTLRVCQPSCDGGGKVCEQKTINDREYCEKGHCVGCKKLDGGCENDMYCCYGLICKDKTCQKPPIKPSTCKKNNEICNYPHECCNGGACRFDSVSRHSLCS